MRISLFILDRARVVTTPVVFAIVGILAATFWVSTSPAGSAPVDCTVCHKRTQSLTFSCNTLEYRRHLDHGDPMGPCAVTPTENP